jgi:hypothetical protein
MPPKSSLAISALKPRASGTLAGAAEEGSGPFSGVNILGFSYLDTAEDVQPSASASEFTEVTRRRISAPASMPVFA